MRWSALRKRNSWPHLDGPGSRTPSILCCARLHSQSRLPLGRVDQHEVGGVVAARARARDPVAGAVGVGEVGDRVALDGERLDGRQRLPRRDPRALADDEPVVEWQSRLGGVAACEQPVGRSRHAVHLIGVAIPRQRGSTQISCEQHEKISVKILRNAPLCLEDVIVTC